MGIDIHTATSHFTDCAVSAYKLTLWTSALPGTILIVQLVNKFPVIYGTHYYRHSHINQNPQLVLVLKQIISVCILNPISVIPILIYFPVVLAREPLHDPHRKHRFQHFYCWVHIRCRGDLLIESLPRKGRII
jgi:hypothetical protein